MKLTKLKHVFKIKEQTKRPKIIDLPPLVYFFLKRLGKIRPHKVFLVKRMKVSVKEKDQKSERLENSAGESYWIPTPVPKIEIKRMRRGYAKFYSDYKYQCPGFVEVEQGDLVVDCGAFVGGFTLAASEKAARIFTLEPSPVNFDCLKRNTAHLKNVVNSQAGLFNESKTLTFNLGHKPFDSSLLEPDAGGTKSQTQVPVYEINHFFEKMGIEKVDFLKIEAEGVEIEILENLDPSKVKKIVVDCNPERDEESPLLDIAVLLDKKGYKVTNLDYILYAKR